ncbi:MAG: hypothetical protein IJF52_03530 [Clostridia bacterium]|nr:hypothetical protein [Clostridia bacterium]
MIKKQISTIGLTALLVATLTGCSQVGSKSATMSAVYLVTSILSLIMLIGYSFLIKKKEPWFIVLFTAVMIINVGYLSLSLSKTLDEALLANRIAYLGSVFLPTSMLMIILKICKIKLNKWAVGVILSISILVFLIAASPGYLDIYYKEVYLVTVNGVSVLDKIYGPLHPIYLYYLLLYFLSMICIIIYAKASKKIESSVHAIVVLGSVIVNIGVWLMEQLVKIDFEFLSISYIVSEVFLLGISLIVQDKSIISSLVISQPQAMKSTDNTTEITTDDLLVKAEYLNSHLYTLTPTESKIYNLYLNDKRTKEILLELNITENTLKYHNKNIYSKLGVTSRKQLIEISKLINNEKSVLH